MKIKNYLKTVDFLKHLFRHCGSENMVNYRFLPHREPDPANEFRFLPKIDSAPGLLNRHNSQNMYFGVALRGRFDGSKDGISLIPAVWLDHDNVTPEVEEAIRGFSLPPSIVIQSSGPMKRHFYWVLNIPLGKEHIPKVESINRRLASYFNGDPQACDASRIMRLPNTLNVKYDPPILSEVLEMNDKEYNISDFESALPPIPKNDTPSSTPQSDWKDHVLPGVEEGERNSAATKLAGRLISKGLSRQEVLDALTGWNQRNTPPLEIEKLETVVESVFRTHERNHPGELTQDKGKVTGKDGKSSKFTLKRITFQEILEYPETRYMIDKILVKGWVHILGGYSGVGKSIVALSIIKSVMDGSPLWKKYPVNETGPVMLIDEETPASLLRDRMTSIRFKLGDPIYIYHFQNIKMDIPLYLNALTEEIHEIKPKLVVIDSLIRVHNRKEQDASEMARVMDSIRKIANLGPAILPIHHHKKGEGPLSQMLRGSSDIVGGIDIEYSLTRKSKNDPIVFQSVKTRVEEFKPINLKMVIDHDEVTDRDKVTGVVYQGRMGDEILDVVKEILSEKDGLDVKEITKAAHEKGYDESESTIRRILSDHDGKEFRSEEVKVGKVKKNIYRLSQG